MTTDPLHDEREEQRTLRAENIDRLSRHERRYGEDAPTAGEAEAEK